MTKNVAKKHVAKPASKPASKANAEQKAIAARIAKALEQGAFKHHRPSRKAAVHIVALKSGRQAAIEYAATLGLAPGTAASWVVNWKKGEDGNAKFKPEKIKA